MNDHDADDTRRTVTVGTGHGMSDPRRTAMVGTVGGGKSRTVMERALARYREGCRVVLADRCRLGDACPWRETAFGSTLREWTPDGIEPAKLCHGCQHQAEARAEL